MPRGIGRRLVGILTMALYVNTNVSGLQGQRHLNNVTNALNTTYKRLASGFRINSAKDDAAGLQISDRLIAQINGLNQANRNASDGIAFAQTAEGALDEVSSMMQKVRTLAVQANNGTNTKADREAIAKEMSSLLTEVHRISEDTTYGGANILNGNSANSLYGNAVTGNNKPDKAGEMTLQVGANSGDTIKFNVESYNFDKIFDRAQQASGNKFGKDLFASANGAKPEDQLITMNPDTGEITVNLDSKKGTASDLINIMDGMIADVDSTRADLGATQNRLESSIRNQSNVAINSADARSRIRDADYAEEASNLTQQSIIQQAAVRMLMQANTRPQLALSMLN